MAEKLEPGELVFDKYKIEKKIGSGGFGEVYKAFDVYAHRLVAIKSLLKPKPESNSSISMAEYKDGQDRFDREVKITSWFTGNPNIITAYSIEHDDDYNYYLVMEYLEGGSLDDLLSREGRLPIPRACEVALDICNALISVHNHRNNIVHRDLKPSNILLRENGQAVVADFGIAQFGHESRRSVLMQQNHPGTEAYSSPEQLYQHGYLSPTSDLYQLGLIMFEMIAGNRYHTGKDPHPSLHNHATPGWLDQIVANLLQESASKRYQKAEEVKNAIQDGIEQEVKDLIVRFKKVRKNQEMDKAIELGEQILALKANAAIKKDLALAYCERGIDYNNRVEDYDRAILDYTHAIEL